MVIPIQAEDRLEARIRRLLRLPEEAPDANPAVWHNGEIQFLRGQELEEARRAWAEEDRRADLARFLASALRPFGEQGWARRVLGKGSSPLISKLTERKLRRTPYLVFLAYGEPDNTPWAVEGYVLFEGGSLPMVLLAAEGLSEHVRRESQGNDHYIFCEENDLLFEERWIVFPGSSVDTDQAQKALLEWYKEIFRNDRHHPLQFGQYPTVRIIF